MRSKYLESIGNSDPPRTYQADFEFYGEKFRIGPMLKLRFTFLCTKKQRNL
nr:hypothetical protein [Pedobacter sp. ASV19]